MLKEDLGKYSTEIETYLAASSSFGVVLLDSDLIIRDCNLGFMRLFGPRQNPAGEQISAYIDLDASGLNCGVELKLSCVRKSGKEGIIHCQFIQKDNGYLLLCERLVLTESRVLEQMGSMNAELINLQRELVKKNLLLEKQSLELQTANILGKESEERFRNMANSAPVLIWISGTDKLYTWFNQFWLDFTGRKIEQELGNGWSESVHFDDYDRCLEIYTSSFNTRQPFSMEYRLRRADGEYRWLIDHGVPTYVENIFTGYIGSCVDVTDRKQAKEKLLKQNSLLETLLNNLQIGIYLIEVPSGMPLLANETSFQLLGRGIVPEANASSISTVYDLHKSDTYEPYPNEELPLVLAMRGVSKHVDDMIVVKPDGTRTALEVFGSPIKDENGNIWAGLVSFQDITSRKRAEEEKQALEQQFQQTQKLESLGVLAGGIAHDFNNILAIIMGYCSLIKMDYEDAEKHIPEIENAAERAAALCRQMLAYAGKASLTQGQVNTRTLVDEMVSMLKTTIQQNVVIKPNLGTDIPFIMGDASQLRQVVMNLIINAAEAIGDAEGEVIVSLIKREIKSERSEKDHLRMIIPAGRYICIEVTDNGCGMDDDTRGKIFEPFYTTKFTGRGLGMSAVLGIIKAHNGALQLESQPEQGTAFKVYLPAPLSRSETEDAQQISDSAPWHGNGTILLAEDEVQVKLIAIALLKQLGFNVIDAANGKEALELYQHNAADITLVVTDMGMPVMNGYELFCKLKQINPQLPIIISSGFGEGDITTKIAREEIAGLINKPYSFDRLREVLKRVMDGIQQT